MPAKKYISKIHKGSDDIFIKDSEAQAVLEGMSFEDVYIGKGVNYTSAMVAANHHDIVVRGEHVNMTCNNSKVWIILKSTNGVPLLAMSGLEVPLTLESDVTQEGVTYKVYSSTNTYTGTFNVSVF